MEQKNSKPKELTRQDLYDLLWSSPKTTIAASLGISDVALGKACQRAQIPIPPRGHWAKLAAGKLSEQIPLPPRGLGKSDKVRFNDRYGYGPERAPTEDLPRAPTFEGNVDSVIAAATKALTVRSIPKTLATSHHAVALLLKKDDERRKAAIGQTYVWDKPRFESPADRRRLKIINSIFLALAQSGFRPDLSGKEANSLRVTVGDTQVAFHVEGRGDRWSRPYDEVPTVASDKAPLTVFVEYGRSDYPTSWVDSKRSPLESRIREIAVGLIVIGEMSYRESELHRHQWRVKQKEAAEEAIGKQAEEARRAAQAAELKERKRRQDWLLLQASNLRRAEDIRLQVQRMQDHPDAAVDGERLADWSDWALSEAARIDPLNNPIERLFLSSTDETQ